ncbi:helix-turn-helix domain-containing protein [Cellulomonas sp. KRMCY2]|uniref:helix-turn-helix domain-containing protein n=1 Tax=Cellulomonas sp. KRMCY2 TaxID=1304865 RepID=UPI00045EC1A6|nr:helix-turn-helix domain-containing protein [Cellulomonas sp. KRMCY2]
MLDAALSLMGERGMSVSLEHLSLEEVIRAAGVSRTSAYRRWPYKDLFLSDLLLELARGNDLGEVSLPLADAVSDLLADRATELHTEAGRRDFGVELLRTASQSDLERISTSVHFRTYIALRATFLGLPDGELRGAVGAALSETERRFTAGRAAVFAETAGLLGYRIAPPLTGRDGFELVARAVGATMTGMVVAALADPDLVSETRTLRAFGSSRFAEWSTPAFVLTGIVVAHLEPDPDVQWDSFRVQHLGGVLRGRLMALATSDGDRRRGRSA